MAQRHRFDKNTRNSSSSDTDTDQEQSSNDSRHGSRGHNSNREKSRHHESKSHDRSHDSHKSRDRDRDHTPSNRNRDQTHTNTDRDHRPDERKRELSPVAPSSASTSANASTTHTAAPATVNVVNNAPAVNAQPANALITTTPLPSHQSQPALTARMEEITISPAIPVTHLSPPATGTTRTYYSRNTFFTPVQTTVTKQLEEKIIDHRSRARTYIETHETASSKHEIITEQFMRLEQEHYARIFTRRKFTSTQMINGRPLENVQISSFDELKHIP